MATKLPIDELADNEIILVSGIVEFSRIHTRLEGEALKAHNDNLEKHGMVADDKPLTFITISGATVLPQDPANLSKGEQYIPSKFYNSVKNPQKGLQFTAKNKGIALPKVYTRNINNPNTLIEAIPDGELASGQKVTLFLRVFAARKNGQHNGLALEGVICEEEPKYYTPGVNYKTINGLQSRGFTVTPASPEAIEAHKAALASATAATAAVPASQPVYNAAAPVAPPVYGAPVTPPVYGAPVVPNTNVPTPPVYNAAAPVPPPVYGAPVAPPVYGASTPVPPPLYGAPAQNIGGITMPEIPAIPAPGIASYPPPNLNGVSLD
jgi:hypothetical protein